MRLLWETVVSGSLMLVLAGCPGTIEDFASFEGRGQASRLDAGSAVEEAGPAQDAGVDAAEASVEEDATVSAPEPDAGEDSGSEEPDAAPEPDAATADAGEDSGVDIGCDFSALIASKCGGCHGPTPTSNTLDLTSPDLAGRLAGRVADNACSSYLLIDPERPDQSALYLKVAPDPCGSRMPLNRTLTDGEQACILRWIENQ